MLRFCAFIILHLFLLLLIPLNAQRYLGHRPTDSGGRLMPEQASYDVKFYNLNLKIDPENKSINGFLEARVKIVQPLEWLVFDLDHRLTVTETELLNKKNDFSKAAFQRTDNQIWIHLKRTAQPGTQLTTRVYYNGKPKEAPAPPWVGGFTWSETEDGQPWIATSMQFDGADLWWPCKDHPSDEPDSMAINITIPKNLTLASNGRLRSITQNKDNTQTFHWFVSNPINNYNVALNIAPYKKLETVYKSTTGDKIPVTFWALPEHYETAKEFFPQFTEHLAFYEKYLGPYPFRADKYGIAETPHLGMEHQTIIAYGRYRNNAFGYDELHHHELGHEWWGNLVTALDWRDFWLHEGFCAYMQALYTEQLQGEQGYHKYFEAIRSKVRNISTLAPREATTAMERYFVASEFIESDGDIYTKGALVLHTLRYLIGDKTFLKSLRRFAYPTPEMEKITDGRQCRFATTDDYLNLVEEITGMELDWFFEVYVRQPVLPNLLTSKKNGILHLHWQTPGDLPFPMPIDVKIADKIKRIEMRHGKASIKIGKKVWEIDPKNWIFRKGNWRN